jgi:hypothetical protein
MEIKFGNNNSKKSLLAEAKKLIKENRKVFNLKNGYLEEDEIVEIEKRIRTCFSEIKVKYSNEVFWEELKNGLFNQLAINAILNKLIATYTEYENALKNHQSNSWYYKKPNIDIWTNFYNVNELTNHFKEVIKKGNNQSFIKKCQEDGVFSINDLNLLSIYWENSINEIKEMQKNNLIKSDIEYFDFIDNSYYRKCNNLKITSLSDLNEKLSEARKIQLNESSNIINSLEKFIDNEIINPFAKWKLNIAYLSHSEITRIGRYKSQLCYYKSNEIEVEVQKEFDSNPNYRGYVFVLTIIDKEILTTSWFGDNKMIKRNRKYISKDVQKVDIQNENAVFVYMHRHFDPEVILLENYDEALGIENTITTSRIKERREFVKKR